MPRSPSMNVIALRHDAVLRNAGSYDISPPSPSAALIWRRSGARIVPSTIGSVYSRPVRLSVIVRVSDGKVIPRLAVGCPRESYPLPAVHAAGAANRRGARRSRSGSVSAQLVAGAVHPAATQRHLVVVDLEHLEPFGAEAGVDRGVGGHRQDPPAAERDEVAA